MQFFNTVCIFSLFITFSKFSTVSAVTTESQSTGDECKFTCSKAPSNNEYWKYQTDHTYKYKVEGSTLLYVPTSVEGDISKLSYSADVDIHFNLCEATIKLENLHVFTADGQKYKDANVLEGLPVKFSWDNGKISPIICTQDGESEVSTNIKRSIISNLQISSWNSNSFYETDVFGQCPVDIQVYGGGTTYTIKKSKDLNKCKNREGLHFNIQSTSFYSNEAYKTNPFVKASLQSVIDLNNGIIQKVEVSEDYNYLPMNAYADSQNTVSVTTKINFVSVTNSQAQKPDGLKMKTATVMYVNPTPKFGSVNAGIIVNALEDASVAASSYGPNVSPTAATEFKSFVNILRDASKSDILSAYVQVKSGAGLTNKQIAHVCFWDGLIKTRTDQSVEAGLTLLRSKQLPQEKEEDFLNSLVFVKYPTISTLNAASPLLDDKQIKIQVYLGIGALVGRYIKNNPNGKDTKEFKEIINKLAAPLASGCITDSIEKEDAIIASLKGLGNVHNLPENIALKLSECLKNRAVSPRIRVALLQALRVDYLPISVKNLVLSILRDFSEDSEIRIQAFHTYIRNPDKETASQIKQLMDTEESTQVGGYVVSYLRNLQKSLQPEKEMHKSYFGDIKTKRRFPFDFRQNSQNYELSQIFAALNLGFSAEADLIFSQKSYMPRSSSINLNTYLFGNEVNLLQVHTRVENAEYVLESTFGPRSYLQTTKSEDMADDVSNKVFKTADTLSKNYMVLFGKAKRTSDDAVKTLFKKKNSASSSGDMLNLDLSLKISDYEISWLNYHVDKKNIMDGHYLDAFYKTLEQSAEDAKNLDINYQKFFHASLLGGNVISYPTSTGFPLTLDADASAVINMQVKGSVNVVDIVKNPENSKIKLDIKPGAVLQVDGALSIDAFIVKAGLKASSSVNTASNFNIDFKNLNGNGIEVKYDLPYDKQDIISIKTEAFSVTQERGLKENNVPLNPVGNRYTYNVQNEILGNLFGITVQAEVDVPLLSLKPTIGPSKFALRYIKTDNSITGHYIKILATKDKKTNAKSFEFLAKTLGREQKVSLLLQCYPKDRKMFMELNLPFKQVSMEAFLVHNDSEFSYNVNLQSDASKYEMKIGAAIMGDENRKTYKPFLYVISPIEAQREKALSDLRLAAKSQSYLPISVDGHMVISKSQTPKSKTYEFASLSLITPFNKFVVDGKIYTVGEEDLDLNITFTYADNKNITIYHNSVTKANSVNNNVICSVVFSQYPDYGIKYTSRLERKDSELSKAVSLIIGPDLDGSKPKILIIQSQETSDKNSDKLVWSWQMDSPVSQFKSNIGITKYPQSCSFNAGFDQAEVNSFALDYSHNFDEKNDINSKIEVAFNKYNAGINGKLFRKSTPGSYGVDGKIKVNGVEKKITSDLSYVWSSTNFTIQATPIVLSEDNTQDKYEFLIQYNPESKGFVIEAYPNNSKQFILKALVTNDEKQNSIETFLFMKDFVDNFAKYYISNESITAQLQIYLPTINRAILGKALISKVADNVYEGNIESNWDATKSKTTTLKINTRTELQNNGKIIKTRNKINVMNESIYELNANINTTGKNENGDVLMDVEFLLPNGTGRMGAKMKYNMQNQGRVYNIEHNAELFYSKPSTAYPAKLAFKFTGKDVDFSKFIFTLQTQGAYVTSQKKDLTFLIMAKRILDENFFSTIGGQFAVGGAFMSLPLDLKCEITYSGIAERLNRLMASSESVEDEPSLVYKYGFLASAGSDYSLNNSGQIINGELSNTVEIKYPYDSKIKTIKWACIKSAIFKNERFLAKTANNFTWDEKKFANWNALLDFSLKNGKILTDWETDTMMKRQLNVTYGFKIPDYYKVKDGYIETSIIMQYDGKTASCNTKFDFDRLSGNLTIHGNGPVNGPFTITSRNQISSDYKTVFSDFNLEHNLGKWHGSGRVELNPTNPLVEFIYVCPDGESKFYLQFEEKIEDLWLADLEVKWLQNGGGYLKSHLESKLLYDLDDMLVHFNVDSPKFNLNNFELLVKKDKKESNVEGYKTLTFAVTNNQQTMVNGEMNYAIRKKEDHKILFDANGHIEYLKRQYPITVSYQKELFISTSTNEKGTIHTGQIQVGNKMHVLNFEHKYTNHGISMKREYCLKGQCYICAFDYQIKINGLAKYEKNMLVQLDLRPFVENSEQMILSSKINRDNFAFDWNALFQWAHGKKIDYNVYTNDKKSGFSLTFPKRQVAAELAYLLNLNIKKSEIKMRAVMWLDKLKDEKNRLMAMYGAGYEITDIPRLRIKTATDLQLPTMPKRFSVVTNLDIHPTHADTVQFKADLDVFNTEDKAISVTYTIWRAKEGDDLIITGITNIISKGQNMDIKIENSGILSWGKLGNNNSIIYLDSKGKKQLILLNTELQFKSARIEINLLDTLNLKAAGVFDFGKDYIEFKEFIQILKHSYKIGCRLTTEPNATISMEWKGIINQRLNAHMTFTSSEYAVIDVYYLDQKQNKDVNIFSTGLLLSENDFLKESETTLNIDYLHEILNNSKGDALLLLESGKSALSATNKNLREQMQYRSNQFKNALVNGKTMMDDISNYLNTIKEELMSDPTFKAIAENMKKVIDDLTKVVFLLLEELSNTIVDWLDMYTQFYNSLVEYLRETAPELVAWIEKSYDDLAQNIKSFIDDFYDSMHKIVEYVKTYKVQWNDVIRSIITIIKELSKRLPSMIRQINRTYKEIVNKIESIMEHIPQFEYIKQKYEQLKQTQIPRKILAVIFDTGNYVKEFMPTMQLRNLIESILAFMDKVLNNQPVNFGEELKKISYSVAGSVWSLIEMANKMLHELNWNQYVQTDSLPYFNYGSVKNVAVMLSDLWPTSSAVMHLVRLPEMSSLVEAFYKYKPARLNPISWIPPYPKMAIIIDGSHIMSFNGKHYGINGDRSYILTMDQVDGNFTVIGELKNGKLNSITVKTEKEYIKISSDGMATLNDAVSDFPAYGKGIYAIRNSHVINVLVDNSLHVICSPDLNVVSLSVSGFYYGRINGLLGSMNNEPYTDYMMPNGKVATSLLEFVESYKIDGKSGISATEIAKGSEISNTLCVHMFSRKQLFARGFSKIKPDEYRQMCDHIVFSKTTEEAKLESACKVSLAYSLISALNGYYVEQSSQCGTCVIGKNVAVKSEINVKTPKKKAEILISLEKLKTNAQIYEELLLKQFMPSIKKLLHEKQIDDVNFVLIGYGPKDKVPSIHTTRGKITFDDTTNLSLSDLPIENHTSFGNFVLAIKYALGYTDTMLALDEISRYSFQPDAAKVVVMIKADYDKRPYFDRFDVFNFINGLTPALTLLEQGIPIIQMSRISKITNLKEPDMNIFGFDSNHLYSSNTTVDAKPYSATNLFRTYESSMIYATAIKGAVFNSNEYISSEKEERVKLSDVFAQNALRSLTTYERTTKCSCNFYYQGIYPQPYCVVQNTNPLIDTKHM